MIMKLIKTTSYLFLLTFFNSLQAQKPTDVLVTINDSIYHVADFERLYTKNIDIIADESQKDVSNYFELYKSYKVRLQDAYEAELDKTDSYKQEFNVHRKQLAEKYFIDEKKLDQLVEEALERSDYEVKASHILFAVNEFAQPSDTLKVYEKAMEVRNELQKGLSFEEAALKYSDDLSAKSNKGNLGYFSVFRMVYPFESAAYNTKVGSVSLPIRSNFGYHLIKVYDKRPTQDIKTIAHILVKTKDENAEEPKKKINTLYARLKLSERFGDTVLHFSEDEHNREKGGVIGVYTEGGIDIKGISDVVYNLNSKNAYSKPFFSQYGWHIVAVTDIKEKPTKETLRPNFLRRIKTDERSKVLEKDLILHLKELYNFKSDDEKIKETAKLLEREELFNEPEIALNEKTEQIVASFGSQTITSKDLLQELYSNPKEYASIKTDEEVLLKVFDTYSLKKLKQQYDYDLEKKFPDFAQTMQDYKEGLMLFDWLEQKVWNRGMNDSIGQKNYFEKHNSQYKDPAYFIGEVYVFKNKSDAKTYSKLLNIKYPVKEDDFPMEYKYQGRFFLDDKRLPKNINLDKIEKSVLKHNNLYYAFLVRDKKKATHQNYEDVKSKVLSDYQKEIEDTYTNKLIQEAKIDTNEAVLNQLKHKYSKKSLN